MRSGGQPVEISPRALVVSTVITAVIAGVIFWLMNVLLTGPDPHPAMALVFAVVYAALRLG